MKPCMKWLEKEKWMQEIKGKTCSKPIENKPLNKISYQTKTTMKENGYTFCLGGNGPPCPSFGSTSLFGMEAWLVEKWRRGRVNGLRGKGSQGTHMGSVTIGR